MMIMTTMMMMMMMIAFVNADYHFCLLKLLFLLP